MPCFLRDWLGRRLRLQLCQRCPGTRPPAPYGAHLAVASNSWLCLVTERGDPLIPEALTLQELLLTALRCLCFGPSWLCTVDTASRAWLPRPRPTPEAPLHES